VTYNFDPERWLEDRRAALLSRRDRGELDDAALALDLARLEHRYEAMLDRLDGTFTLPRTPGRG